MKIVTPIISMAAVTTIASAAILVAAAPEDIAVKPSPGVTAEHLLNVQDIGRTNTHSGGRTGGHANKRHGGGGRNHPNSIEIIEDTTGVQPAGRTNTHSDGRAGGKALPRRGTPTQRGFGRHGIRKVDYTLDVIVVEPAKRKSWGYEGDGGNQLPDYIEEIDDSNLIRPVSSTHGTNGTTKVKTSHSVRPGGPPSRPKRR